MTEKTDEQPEINKSNLLATRQKISCFSSIKMGRLVIIWIWAFERKKKKKHWQSLTKSKHLPCFVERRRGSKNINPYLWGKTLGLRPCRWKEAAILNCCTSAFFFSTSASASSSVACLLSWKDSTESDKSRWEGNISGPHWMQADVLLKQEIPPQTRCKGFLICPSGH